MLSFSEFDLKWSVHVITVLNLVQVNYTWFSYFFTFEVNALFLNQAQEWECLYAVCVFVCVSTPLAMNN